MKCSYKGYIFLLIYLFTIHWAQSQPVIPLDGSFGLQMINHTQHYLIDKTHQLTLEQVRDSKNAAQWKPNKKKFFTLGTGNLTVWIRFRVKLSPKARNSQYLLELDNTQVNRVVFYRPDDTGKYEQVVSGDHYPFAKRGFRTNRFLFKLNDLEPDKVYTFYVQCTNDLTLAFPLLLGTYPSFMEQYHLQDVALGLFAGWMLIMIFYNLFLWTSIRDISYLYYVGYISFVLIYILTVWGYTIEFLWPNRVGWNNYLISYAALFTVFAHLFAHRCMHTRRYARVTRKISWYGFFPALGTLLVLNFTNYNVLAQQLSLPIISLSGIFLLIMGGIVFRRGYQPARYYLLGWGIFISLGIINIFQSNLGLTLNPIVMYGVEIGTAAEALLFSLALADRINFYKKEKQKASKQAYDALQENKQLLEDQNQQLEQKVRARTEEINSQNEELLMQQEEMTRQKNEIEQLYIQLAKSLQVAENIQHKVLPEEHLLQDAFQDYFVLYLPKDIVSGDFYWLEINDNTTYLAVADCTGHGVPAAFITLIGKMLLDKMVKDQKVTSPAQMLTQLNQEIFQMLHQEENFDTAGMVIALLKLESQAESNKVDITFASARHHLYYFREGADKLSLLKGEKKYIGGFELDISFENQHLTLSKGDLFYLGSDGLADQNNPRRRSFGSKRILQLLEKYRQEPLNQQKAHLYQALKAHQSNATQRDDILWMGVEL